MKCYRFDYQRQIPRFLDGELNAQKSERLLTHVQVCGDCSLRFKQFSAARELLTELPQQTPQRDHWEVIEAALDAEAFPVTSQPRWLWNLATPRFAVAVLALMVVTLSALLLLRSEPVREIYATKIVGSVDYDEFQPVSISGMENNTKPHVVAEGYVSEIIRNEEGDGDLTFKLAERPDQPSPFIVCEIIQPIHIAPPAIGSRVRVYGVSRYDAGEGRNWYEVHPVLNIEAVRR